MTEQTMYSLISACFGFVSAGFFGAGASFMSLSKLVSLSRTSWDFNHDFAKANVSQSTEYSIGAILLIFSFALQVVSTQVSSSPLMYTCPVLGSIWIFVPTMVLVITIPSYLLCRWLSKKRLAQVIAMLKETA